MSSCLLQLHRSERGPKGDAGRPRRRYPGTARRHALVDHRRSRLAQVIDDDRGHTLVAASTVEQVDADGDGFVWLGIVEPEPEELEQVQERFGLHDLAVEDAQSFHLRPKVEQYEDDERVLFVVLRTAVLGTFSLIEDRREGFLQGVLVAPVPRSAIVFGKVMGGTSIAVLQGAALLLVVGNVLARFFSRSVLITAVNMNLDYARLLSIGVKWLVLVLTWAMVLDHLALGKGIVDMAFGILFGGIVLALSLAVGLGSRDLVSRSLERDAGKPVEVPPAEKLRPF